MGRHQNENYREASLNYAAARKRRLENRENQLEKEVLALENKLN